jgi:hypothetical protein
VYIKDSNGKSVGNWQAKKLDQPEEVEYKNRKYSKCTLTSSENRGDIGRVRPIEEKPTGSYAECPVSGARTIRFYTDAGKVYYTADEELTELYQDDVSFETTPSPLEIFPPFYNTSISLNGKNVGSWSRQLNEAKFDISFLGRTYNKCKWHNKDFE